jgi:D-sedoheptulose 7-phosphate isomerase
MNIANHINAHIKSSVSIINKVASELSKPIENSVNLILEAFINKNKLLIAGNGGSAADAQHLAAEFIIRLNKHIERRALPAIALTADSSILTAAGNDIGFKEVFARQVQGLGNDGDIFLAISTSGNSENLLKAADQAHKSGLKVIGLLGNDGGMLREVCDIVIIVNDSDTQHIQEAHICIYHIICDLVERLYIS